MMESSSRSDSEEDETSAPFSDYENPNYRKLYASLSVTAMMGSKVKSSKIEPKNDSDDLEDDDDINETTKLTDDSNEQMKLPEGWEKHEDDSGPYYWHIPSGTIQRQVPTISLSKRDSLFYFDDDGLDRLREQISNGKILDDKFPGDGDVFTVHSLGWMEFDESCLTPELSSKAIKRCILELSTQTENAVKCWGKEDTKQLTLKIANSCLQLLDPSSSKVLTIQPIANIRVWGVNDVDDFAYVARDPEGYGAKGGKGESGCYGGREEYNETLSPVSSPTPVSTTPILKCHVFHCESLVEGENSAQKVANLLKEEMIRIKSHQSLSSSTTTTTTTERKGETDDEPSEAAIRPSHLSIDEYTGSPMDSPYLEFPTPIEEPKKTIVARYLGKTPVPKPMGVDILNEAIERIIFDLDRAYPPQPKATDESDDTEKPGRGIVSLVHISPSTITVESTIDRKILVECRVRYLSFLGISKNTVENCGFILQVDENLFEAHCFECEPSSGALCKTIEAACKLRFQKCLDAHKQRCNNSIYNNVNQQSKSQSTTSPNGNSSSTLKPSQSMGAIKNTLINTFSKLLYKR